MSQVCGVTAIAEFSHWQFFSADSSIFFSLDDFPSIFLLSLQVSGFVFTGRIFSDYYLIYLRDFQFTDFQRIIIPLVVGALSLCLINAEIAVTPVRSLSSCHIDGATTGGLPLQTKHQTDV